jgi:hypothetical protein
VRSAPGAGRVALRVQGVAGHAAAAMRRRAASAAAAFGILTLCVSSAAAVQCLCPKQYLCKASATLARRESERRSCAGVFELAVTEFVYSCPNALDDCHLCLEPTVGELRGPLPLAATGGVCKLSGRRVALVAVLACATVLLVVTLTAFVRVEWRRLKIRRARRAAAAETYCKAVREASEPTAFLPLASSGRSDALMLCLVDSEEAEAAVAAAGGGTGVLGRLLGRRRRVPHKLPTRLAAWLSAARRRRRGSPGGAPAAHQRREDAPADFSSDTSTVISDDESLVTPAQPAAARPPSDDRFPAAAPQSTVAATVSLDLDAEAGPIYVPIAHFPRPPPRALRLPVVPAMPGRN